MFDVIANSRSHAILHVSFCRLKPMFCMQIPILGEHSESWFYLEEAKNDKPLVTINPGKMLLFFKLYDPWRKTLSYLGRCYAHDTNTLPALMPFLYKKAGFPDGTDLKVGGMLPVLIMPC